ncbi:C40 family peptidase [Alteribacillus sp. HJP-4]|uniref:C40 family peptidase n=1 Tax=Alteribacillus sp. HJP-4 TaxID=2775394 RepID=UPI0035CD06C0
MDLFCTINSGNFEESVLSYNHADWYVDDVMAYADSYVDGYVEIDIGELPSGATEELVQVGTEWIGNSKYVFGGGRNLREQTAGKFDCSSFVYWAFDQVGMSLGDLGSVSTETLKHMGESVSVDNIQPGDHVFFDTYKRDGHVAIYAGDGQFIGAQSSTGVAFESMEEGLLGESF